MKNETKRAGRKPKKIRHKNATMLQTEVLKKRRGGDNAKPSAVRRNFLRAFESSFGNISLACEAADIHRTTFYRWMKSRSRVNVKFQEMVRNIQPVERQKDYLEAALMTQVGRGDTAAIIYGLKTKAKDRGYSEKPVEVSTVELLSDDSMVRELYRRMIEIHKADKDQTLEALSKRFPNLDVKMLVGGEK